MYRLAHACLQVWMCVCGVAVRLCSGVCKVWCRKVGVCTGTSVSVLTDLSWCLHWVALGIGGHVMGALSGAIGVQAHVSTGVC